MTLIEDLVEGASGDTPVGVLLRKVKVVASRAGVPALDEWVQHELDGYPEESELPSYRGPFDIEVRGNFAGIGGTTLTHASIPSAAFDNTYEKLFRVAFIQPIAEIEHWVEGDGPLKAAWPANVVGLVNGRLNDGTLRLYEGLSLMEAWREISRAKIASVVDAVRNRILDLALSMEKTNPNLGQPDAAPLSPESHEQIVNHIYGAANVAIASTNFTQAAAITQGDRDALTTLLGAVGVPDDQIAELYTAIEADGSPTGTLGPATTTWLGRLMTHAADLGIGAAGGIIAEAVAHYLGVG